MENQKLIKVTVEGGAEHCIDADASCAVKASVAPIGDLLFAKVAVDDEVRLLASKVLSVEGFSGAVIDYHIDWNRGES